MSKPTLKITLSKQALTKIKDKVLGIKDAFTEADANALGEEVVSEMKRFISKGVSPVEGIGRFRQYSKNYPESVQGEYPAKRKRPVNLYLSGQMLSELKHKVRSGKFGKITEVGFYDKEASDKAKKNAGLGRPALPEDADRLLVSIQRIIFKRFREALLRNVKK